MEIQKILSFIRSVGLGPALCTLRYTLLRDRLDRRYYPPARRVRRKRRPIPTTPGLVMDTRLIPSGARFRFEQAELEIHFLAPDLVRVTWQPLPPAKAATTTATPAEPDQSYAISRLRWPDVTDKWQADLAEMTFSTRAMQVVVQGDGGLIFRDLSGKTLREEFPPEFLGETITHRTLLQPDERIYGLGERAAPLNRRGGSFRMWNTDPSGVYGPGKDPIYIGIPVYLSLHAQGSYLAFYDNSFPATFTFETAGEARFEGGELRYYVIPGPIPRAIERYTELTGRADLPPRWALGYHQCRWGYKSEDDIRQVVAGFEEHDLPLSAIHLDIDYMDSFRVFTVHPARFPDLPALARDLDARDIKLVAILDPGVKRDPKYDVYRDGLKAGVFCRLPNGKPLHGLVWSGWSAFPDFTDPKAREWWGSYYPRLLDTGIAGFWHDMNEPTSFAAWGDLTLPLAARHDFDGAGGDHRQAHNLYALLMARAGYETLRKYRPDRRPWIITRAGWAGFQRYAWNWTGDTETSWGALRMTVPTVLGLGLSGQPFSGPDVGGFSGGPSAELYLRWLQLAAFLPFFRTHSALGTPRREPWVFGEPATAIARNFLRLRYRLLPSWYTLAWEASQTGHPPVRPLFWQDVEDIRLWEIDDTFTVGDDLLVAPILEEGGLGRQVILPKGDWYHFWEDTRHAGSGEVEVEAPLERIPLFVRAGTILPMEEAGQLTLHVYPPSAGKRSSQMYSDSGDGFGPWRLDHFHLSRIADGLELAWNAVGEYPFPYTSVVLQVHGMAITKAWVDGKMIPCKDGQVETGVFGKVLLS